MDKRQNTEVWDGFHWLWLWGCRFLGCDTVQTSRRNIGIATSIRLYGITFQHTAVLEGKRCLYFSIFPDLVLQQRTENKNGAFSRESLWIDFFFQLVSLVLILFQVTHWQSPYMHAYFPALNSFPSLLGDMLADAINCLGFTWVSIAVYSSRLSVHSPLITTVWNSVIQRSARTESSIQIKITACFRKQKVYFIVLYCGRVPATNAPGCTAA